jgi:acetoin utilization protein AcuC
MYEAAAWSTGASMRAVETLLSGDADVAVNFSGGLHHAMPGYASGFCIFNDPVIAIKALTQRGFKVAYVDIDCHHGDGVQHAFYDTDQVLTISIHESGRFLFPGTGFPEELGTGKALREVVPPLVSHFRPDILVTQLGIDTHYRDPLTHLALTVQGFGLAVEELGKLSPGKWLALGGGGYDISAVTRGWTIAYGRMLGREWPEQVPASSKPSWQSSASSSHSTACQGCRKKHTLIYQCLEPAKGLPTRGALSGCG